MLTTLLTSFGAPLLLAGDEMGRTQGGNNNAVLPGQRDHLGRLGDGRHRAAGLHPSGHRAAPRHPVLRRRRFLTGAEAEEIEWFTPAGPR